MLTAKHIDAHGLERLFAVIEVEYSSNESVQATQACAIGFTHSTGRCRFVFDSRMRPDQIDQWVYEGAVYVMNDTGKTIQKYDLGGWALPQPNVTPSVMVGARIGSAGSSHPIING